MKKNGFVASSLIYTFVVVFLGLMLFLLNSYYRVGNLADKYKLDIRTSLLNDKRADLNIDMMVWNEITKEYEKVKDVPKIGYYFESDYSYCENNSQLNYQNGIITLKDYCYAYFKKRDEDIKINIYTKEKANSEEVLVNSIPSPVYKIESSNCTNGAQIKFTESDRKFTVKAKNKTECKVVFVKRQTDIELQIYKESASGNQNFENLKYMETDNIPGLNYEFYKYVCDDNNVKTTIYEANNNLKIESKGKNNCQVYYKGGTDKVEIIVMIETNTGNAGYTTGKKYSRTSSVPGVGYNYVGYICEDAKAKVTYENNTFTGTNDTQTACRIYFDAT